jgi:hypothetical protein
MMQKQKLRLLLILGLVFVSLGGWVLHGRIHPPSELPLNYIPFIAGLIGMILVPILFLFRKTVAYAYAINGMLVIIGTITMAHFSLAHRPESFTLVTVAQRTLLPDIAILFVNFMLGKVIFELELLRGEDTPARHGRFFRYPNMGWWGVHLFTLSAVYTLGHLLWS